MSIVSDTYARLTAAMETEKPACTGIDMFTSDDLDREDRQILEKICDGCNLRTLCADYARAARPPAGFWPGTGTKKRNEK